MKMLRRIKILAALVCTLMLLTSCTIKPAKQASSASSVSSDSSSSENTSVSTESTSSPDESSSVQESVSKTESDPGTELSLVSTPKEDIIQSPLYRSAVLYCVDDNRVLYNDGAEIKTAPASMTKLITASVMLEYMKPGDIVTVGTELSLVNPGSSICYIEEGNRLTVQDLLTGMLLNSGNDAAYTAAVTTARAANPDKKLTDEEAVQIFVTMMNELAAKLGMSNSYFMNPDGWDNSDQCVTGADMIKLCKHALSNSVIRRIVGTFRKNVVFESGEEITWTNTNSLLDPNSTYYLENAIGMKTGTTDNAGCCLAAAFKKDGKTYISVVTGCNTSDDRFEATQKLYLKIA